MKFVRTPRVNDFFCKIAIILGIGAFICSYPVSAAEDAIEIPGQILIISDDAWNDRTVNISGKGEQDVVIYGGEKTGKHINLGVDGSNTFLSVYGGYYDGVKEEVAKPVTGNLLDVYGNENYRIIYDDPEKTSSEYASLYIYDTKNNGLIMNAIAGHAGKGEASGNTINLRGGLLNGYVIAAETNEETKDDAKERLKNNTVNLLGDMDLSWASVFGAAVFSSADRSRSPFMGTNNTFNVYVKDADINELAAFNNYNFYLPTTTKANDLEVNVNGSMQTDISGCKILAILPNSVMLQLNDKVTLLRNNAGIPDNASTSYAGIHSDTKTARGRNISAYYDLIVEKEDEHNVILRLQGVGTTPESKQIPQTRVPTIINRSGDFLANGGISSAETAGAQIYTPFFAAEGGSMSYTTGSHVDTQGYNMILGMSRKINNPTRDTLIAPFFEYGRGNYDAYLDSGHHGAGNMKNVGGGIVFRTKMTDGSFYEASLRGGRYEVDYGSNDFMFNGEYVYEGFRSSSPYYGLHIGGGKEVPISLKEDMTYYGKFFYSHIGHDNIKLTTGDKYYLSPINSYRLRLGTRYAYKADAKNKLYLGLAWEHEFNASAHAVYEGLRTPSPSLQGDSGLFELGWVIRPEGDDRMSFDLSTTAWIGKQEGFTGRFGINWMF